MAEAFTLEVSAVTMRQRALQEIANLAKSLGNSLYLDSMNDDELTEHWLDAHLLEPLEWDETRNAELAEDEAITLGPQPWSMPRPQIRRLLLPVVPKQSNARVLTLRPEQGWSQRGPSLASTAAYDKRNAVIILRGTAKELNNLRTTAQTLVTLINEDVACHYKDFHSTVLSIVQARRAQLADEANEFAQEAKELGVQIRRRSDAPRLVDVRERAEVSIIRQQPLRKATADDPQLSVQSVHRIIDLIDQAGRSFELARKEFRKLGEDGLRHILVSYLNAVFQSTAVTGETFSKDGKADLVVMVDGRAVLVGECKIWDGASLYEQTLGNQLSRYVLWRHSVAVLVTFSPRHNLSAVLGQAKRVAQDHCSYRSGLADRSETYFVSTHEHPDDAAMTMEVHHLFFNLHSTRD